MAIRNIVKLGDDTLRKVCKPQEKFDLRLWTLLKDMADTMYKAEGVGLAGPQVGILRRVVVISTGEEEGEILELVNPTIVATEGEQDGLEGCLSVPGYWGRVKRPMKATVRAQDRNGEWFERTGEAMTARCFCHEVDHLDGRLYTELVEGKLYTNDELEEMMEEQED